MTYRTATSFMNISRYALTAQDYLYSAGDVTIGFRTHSER